MTEDPGPLDGPDDDFELDAAPDAIVELCASCIDYVRSALNMELDLTPETLPILDHYLRSARDEVDNRPELLPLLARSVGAYFGEVVRRDAHTFWYLPSEDIERGRLGFVRVFLAVNPVAVAYDALTGRTTHDGPSSELLLLPHERDVVFARLTALPEVPDDEFYSLSTRLEVLQIANDALRSEMLRAEVEGTLYDAEDYAAELRER